MAQRTSLHPAVTLSVLSSAASEEAHYQELGCSIQGPNARQLRRATQPLTRWIAKLGREEAQRQAKALLKALEETAGYRALCDGTRRVRGRRRLREEVLFPSPTRHLPRVLNLRRGTLGLDLPVAAKDWPRFADLFATLSNGATRAELASLSRGSSALGELLTDLRDAGWLVRQEAPEVPLGAGGALFVGHNTVLFSPGKTRLLIDPYFRPAGERDLGLYAPLQPKDLGHVDAVAITHSHGDHFHLGSLLQLPRETPILVPAIERESLFTTDFAARLAQVGFTHVVPMKWNTERVIGDLTVRALPFHGEQPTDGEGLYDGLFNEGNTWHVSGPKLSAVFLADAGRDVRGDIGEVCRELGREAKVDLLFSGIRGFKLRPLFFGSTTLEPFLANVPLEALDVPQQLMADPEEALDYGKLLGARYVVPCADGGAPWYWREGMGPYYVGFPDEPGVRDAPHEPTENPDADPFPERLEQVRAKRTSGPEALLMRPGDVVQLKGKRREPELFGYQGFAWPF